MTTLSNSEARGFAATARYLLKGLDQDRLNKLVWRHHGLGMLQGELTENLRIHIWHPQLVTIPRGLRQVHDHRFDIMSYVAVGHIIDTPWSVFEKGDDRDIPRDAIKTELHEIVHAKEQEKVKSAGCSTATMTKSLGDVHAEEYTEVHYHTGSVYQINSREFHTTRVEDLAITFIHRSNFVKGLARILGPSGIVGSAIVEQDVTKAKGGASPWAFYEDLIYLAAARFRAL